MTDVAALFPSAVEELGRRVRAVDASQWAAPTPDDDWDVRALVNHVTVEDLWLPPLLEGLTIAQVGDRFDGDQLGLDPGAAWSASAASAIAAVAAEGAMERTVHVSFGDIPGSEYLSQLVTDHVVHAWDLARSIGDDEALDTDLVDFVLGYLRPQAELWRSAGAFGPAVDVPAGAGAQVELLALTGRRA